MREQSLCRARSNTVHSLFCQENRKVQERSWRHHRRKVLRERRGKRYRIRSWRSSSTTNVEKRTALFWPISAIPILGIQDVPWNARESKNPEAGRRRIKHVLKSKSPSFSASPAFWGVIFIFSTFSFIEIRKCKKSSVHYYIKLLKSGGGQTWKIQSSITRNPPKRSSPGFSRGIKFTESPMHPALECHKHWSNHNQ